MAVSDKDYADLLVLANWLSSTIHALGGQIRMTPVKLWRVCPKHIRERTSKSEFVGFAKLFLKRS